MKNLLLPAICIVALQVGVANAAETNLYWGDTHLHTNLSPDAFFNRLLKSHRI